MIADLFDLVLLHIVSSFYCICELHALTVLDGFDGADKVFLLEFSMPMDDTSGFNAGTCSCKLRASVSSYLAFI